MSSMSVISGHVSWTTTMYPGSFLLLCTCGEFEHPGYEVASTSGSIVPYYFHSCNWNWECWDLMAINEYNICDKLRCMVLEELSKAIVIAIEKERITMKCKRAHDRLSQPCIYLKSVMHFNQIDYVSWATCKRRITMIKKQDIGHKENHFFNQY